jgi:hypothetical protein
MVSKFVLGNVYIHPNDSSSAIECCIYRSLLEYSKSIKKIISRIKPHLHTPMIATGDFNVDVSRNRSLQDLMQRKFNLTYVQTTATTLGNTCTDLTFARNLNVSCLPFVSYFSYHRTMINNIVINYSTWPRRRCVDNIKMDLREMRWCGLDWYGSG